MKRLHWPCLTIVTFLLFTTVAGAATTLRLTIQKPDGQPLAEMPCKLELKISPKADQERSEKRDRQTDAEGVLDVVLPPLTRYSFVLTAEGVGHAIFGPRFTPEDGQITEATLKLTRSGCLMVHVTRKEDGTPIQNAWAHIYEKSGMSKFRFDGVRTDGEGYCIIPDIPPGQFGFSVSAQDFLGYNTDIDVTGGDELQKLEVQLRRGVEVTGVVLLEDGETPAVGAEVSRGQRSQAVQADANGGFSFDNMGPGRHLIYVWHEDFVKHEAGIDVAEDDAPPPVKIVLKNRGGSLSGVAENADTGKPMPGETVVAALYTHENPDFDTHWLTVERLLRERLEQYERFRWFGKDWPRTVTDEAGRYEFEHLPAGKYLVCVIPKDMPGGRREGAIVEEGKSTEDVTVQATGKPKGFLLMRFLNEQGEPLKDALRFEMKGGGFTSNGGVNKDDLGCWYWQCRDRDGEMNLSIAGDGYASVEKTLTLNADEFQEIVVTMRKETDLPPEEQARAILAGRVLMPDGKTPAVGALVVPFAKDRHFPESDMTSGDLRLSQRMSVTTDAEGAFRIANLRPGEYGVYVTPREHLGHDAPFTRPELADCMPVQSSLLQAVANETAKIPDIVFGKAATLHIRVLDAETGKPLPEATCRVRSSVPSASMTLNNLIFSHFETDKDGKVAIDGLRGGEYRVRIYRNDYESESELRAVVKDGQEVSLDVKLRPNRYGDVSGIVRLPDGTLAEGAKMLLSPATEDPVAVADANGRFEVKNQQVGTRLFYVVHPGFALAKQEFEVVAGKTNELVFDLIVGGALNAQVLDDEGNPADEDVRIVLTSAERATSSIQSLLNRPYKDVFVATPDDEGRVSFEHLPAWSMVLLVVKDKDVLGVRSGIEIADGKVLELTLSSQKEVGVIEGRIVGLDDTPVPDARIHILGAYREGGATGAIKTDADGRYRTECLAGRWAVGVQSVSEEKPVLAVRGSVDVKGGETTTADIKMGPYGSIRGKITDAEGQPVAGARVATLGDERNFGAMISEISGVIGIAMGEVDQNGCFTLGNLSAGEYNLYVTLRNQRTESQPVATIRVEAGKESVADIVLEE